MTKKMIDKLHMLMKKLKRKLQKLFFTEQWSLLFCGEDGSVLKHIVPPAGRIWADPFPVEADGRRYIFLEQQFNRKNGTLGYIELFDDLSHSEFVPVLEKPYHLSYPGVFRHEGVWYLVPESHENGSIDLYRASSFPVKWEFHSTLINGITAVDSTLLFHGNVWWLFTSAQDGGNGLNSSLSLYYSDVFPSTDWKPHPANPVARGAGWSRMAGAVIRDEKTGRLVRPAQSCVREYGEHLVLREITELTKTGYGEHTIREIMPERGLHAVCTHTLNMLGALTVRDIKTRRWRL